MKSTDRLVKGKKEKKDFKRFLKSEKKKQLAESGKEEELQGEVGSTKAEKGKRTNKINDKKHAKLAKKVKDKDFKAAMDALVGKRGVKDKLKETRTKIILTVLVPVIFMAVYGYVSYMK